MNWITSVIRLARKVIEERLERFHTTIPAQVVSYDADKNTCSIQPCIRVFRSDDTETGTAELPQLDDIPVKFAGGDDVFLTCPVVAGQYGVYHVSEDDVNAWLDAGGIVDPISIDRFNLDTGFFEPVAPWSFDSSFGAIATDRISLRTRDGKTEVSVLKNGNVEINVSTGKSVTINGNSDAAALASVVDDYFSKLDTLIRTTWVPAPTDGGAALKTAYTAAIPAPPTTAASQIVKVDS